MKNAAIKADGICLDIPIYEPGSMRLFRKSHLKANVGAIIGREGNHSVVRALDNVSFEANAGDRVALIGHNGSGKTTLLKLMSGVYQPDSGTLGIHGSVGAVLDVGLTLIDELTGYESIKLYSQYKQLSESQRTELVADMEEFTELGEFLTLPIRTYSAGMRSRLAAGLATSLSYDILLIDEGIGAGDADFQEKFKKRVDAYLESAPILFMASHSVDLLKQYCTKGLVLKQGQLKFSGSVEDALKFYSEGHGEGG